MSASLLERPAGLDVAAVRAEFPILRQTVHGKPLVYLDSAASAQKPRAVIDAMRVAMETQYANVHRGLHAMSERTTEAYEAARGAVAALIGAARAEIVFTRNATEAINLVAPWGGGRLWARPASLTCRRSSGSWRAATWVWWRSRICRTCLAR